MKKVLFGMAVLLMTVTLALALTECAVKGGTIVVRNSTGASGAFRVFGEILLVAQDRAAAVASMKTIAEGETESWSFDEDGDYYALYGNVQQKVTLSGGDSIEVEFTGNN
jgi:hypothetical protein